MKKTFVVLLCFFQAFVCFSTTAYAVQESYHWYCAHVAGHVQPSASPELQFVEDLGGYYIDHRCTDAEDSEKVIYLTFDAGYENGNIAKTLDILKAEAVPGAFFVLGHLVRNNTDLVKRMAMEGHLVCNHTVRHKDMSGFSDADFLAELQELENLYAERVGGKMAAFYRPPEGTFSRENLLCAKENGYRTIFWSFAYPDWNNNRQPDPQKAKKMILDNAHNGEIMLLHPTSDTNVAILGDVIRELKAAGYRFGSLEQLVAEEG